MKFLFISDIHGSVYYTKMMEERILEENPKYIVLLGDLLYHGPRNPILPNYDPSEVSNILNKYKEKIICVRGNCDCEVDQMMLEFDIMSTYSNLIIDKRRIFLTHGHIYNYENTPNLNRGDIFIQGHTHISKIERRENIFYINPGSISLPKDKSNSYGVYKDEEFTIKDLSGKILKKSNLKV